MSDSSDLPPVEWNDFSELHRTDDGGGLLSSMKAIRQGTLAQLVHFVASLPDDEQRHYVIEVSRGNTIRPGEIVMLSRRPDFPHP